MTWHEMLTILAYILEALLALSLKIKKNLILKSAHLKKIQFFLYNKKLQYGSYIFTCILPNYVAHETIK